MASARGRAPRATERRNSGSRWICAVKEKGLKRFVFFCFAAQMLVLVPEVMVSTDAWRFITAAFISQFAVFFAVYYDEKSRLNRLLRL